MPRSISRLGLGLGLQGSAGSAGEPDPYGPNLVTNGGFETGDTTGWFDVDFCSVTSAGGSYKGSYHLMVNAEDGLAVYRVLSGIITSGDVIRVEFMAKAYNPGLTGEANYEPELEVRQGTNVLEYFGTPALGQMLSFDEWRQYVIEFTSVATVAQNFDTNFVGCYSGPNNHYYLDDLKIRKVL